MIRGDRGRLLAGSRPFALLIAALVSSALAPARGGAQLAVSGPRWPDVLPDDGAGASPDVAARNPALASRDGARGIAWAAPALELRVDFAPVTLRDLFGAPEPVSRALRERWLQRIEQRGAQRGEASARVRWGAAAGAGWAVELASAAWTRSSLDPDAAELLLFGNVGRTGDPRPLAPYGSVDAALLTTLTAGAARPVNAPWPGRTTIGFAVNASLGHGVWVGRDAGSLATAEPPTLMLRFPVLDGPLRAHAGSGGGLHVGASWTDGPWHAGIAVRNAVARFRWRREGLSMRPGEAVLGPDPPELDDDPRPLEEAPAALLAALDSLRPPEELSLAVARTFDPTLRLAAAVRARARGGVADGARLGATLAAEWSPRADLPLRAAGELGEGLAVGVGAEPTVRGWRIELGGAAGVLGARRDLTFVVGLRRRASAGEP